MILIDTSVWIDHLREAESTVQRLLGEGRVLSHPLVIGELAVGSFRNRDGILSDIGDLPRAAIAEDDEVLRFISEQKLFGFGLSYIDAHLLAAVRLTPDAQLWARDKRVREFAEKMRISYKELQ